MTVLEQSLKRVTELRNKHKAKLAKDLLQLLGTYQVEGKSYVLKTSILHNAAQIVQEYEPQVLLYFRSKERRLLYNSKLKSRPLSIVKLILTASGLSTGQMREGVGYCVRTI